MAFFQITLKKQLPEHKKGITTRGERKQNWKKIYITMPVQ